MPRPTPLDMDERGVEPRPAAARNGGGALPALVAIKFGVNHAPVGRAAVLLRCLTVARMPICFLSPLVSASHRWHVYERSPAEMGPICFSSVSIATLHLDSNASPRGRGGRVLAWG